jgi:hypothetical protein
MLGGIIGYLVAMVAYVVYRIDTAEKEVMIVIVEMSGDEIEDGAGENTGTRKIKVVGEFVERFDVVNAQRSPDGPNVDQKGNRLGVHLRYG